MTDAISKKRQLWITEAFPLLNFRSICSDEFERNFVPVQAKRKILGTSLYVNIFYVPGVQKVTCYFKYLVA